MTLVSTQRVELRQSTANVLQFPIFLAVVIVAIVVRQFIGSPPSPVIIGVALAALALVGLFAWYLLRNTRATLIVTPDEITFTRHAGGNDANQQVIRRAEGSMLSFRVARNGPMGSKYTGYVRKLRDNASGNEVFAGAFGRSQVQQACESQGWSFG